MGKKKICLDGLKKVMNPKEMKNILGGSGSCCIWESPTPDWGCTDTAIAAEFMATPNGWWGCNTAEAIERCRC